VRLGANLAFTLAAENLFDVAYRTYASGAYAPGRSVVFGLRASL
jgi:outer membrane receptor protein involved in Fe transport